MSENAKNIEVVENENTEVAEVKESKMKGFVTKVGKGVKKHGKKIVAGVAIGALGLAAYALGARSKNEDSDDCCYGEDDAIDVEYSEVEETE